MMREPLGRYREILSGKRKPAFLSAGLDEKARQAREVLRSCRLCERRCGVNRLEGERGFCKAGKGWSIFGAHAHLGEEAELVPSGTIFLAGCTLRCVYCQNAPASCDPELGAGWTDRGVADWICKKFEEGCRNVNFVTPDCYLWNIIRALRLVKRPVPVVWNSNAYYSEESARLLKGIVDLYLLDFRYFSDECSERLSSAPRYPEVAKRNHLMAKKDADLIIRVLVMPNHIDCDAKPILGWIRDKLGHGTMVNILPQYRPCHKAHDYPDIDRPLRISEYEEVVSYAKKIGLENLL